MVRIVYLLVLLPWLVLAKTIHVTPADDWFAVLHGTGLHAGDEVVLGPGVYSSPRRLEMSHRGRNGRPVVIRGSGPGASVIQRPDARQNSVNIAGAQYLVLRDLEITGGSSAIRISKSPSHPARFITLERLHIHHIGGPGVTCNHAGNQYEGMRFVGCEIHHTGGHGEAFYLGGNYDPKRKTGSAIFFNGLIEGNYLHDLRGPNISQGDGIELKPGSFGNVVRNNVIVRTGYPGILVYTTGGKPRNIIEGNFILEAGDHGIQAASDAIIRNNIILHSRGNGLYARNHQNAVVGHLDIRHNTIIQAQGGPPPVRVIEPAGAWSGPVVLANNALWPMRLHVPKPVSRVANAVLPSARPLPAPDAVGDARFGVAVDFFGAKRDGALVPGACGAGRAVPTKKKAWVDAARKRGG